MLCYSYPMNFEEAITLVILNSARWLMKWRTIYLKDTPFSIMADKEIWFPVLSILLRSKPCFAIWKEKNTCSIKCLSDFYLRC